MSCQPLQGSFMTEFQEPASYDIHEDISWLFQNDNDYSSEESAVPDFRPHGLNQTISVLQDAHDVVYGQFVPDENVFLQQDMSIDIEHTSESFVYEDRTFGAVDTSCSDDVEHTSENFVYEDKTFDAVDTSCSDDAEHTSKSFVYEEKTFGAVDTSC